ncbi:ARM REPEAT PROTEIN INTERACTING WITH ABF2-like [Vicia villosa]|uniref:ARM REPEAT PROTEIN INTERACTING WITH ABF2-like n=1 Tax=Vicia villosa TaxID=3911 RepID=UPI00273C42A7|nr:ARM REPEAT PROTEIN INTERACTING WITH ABF2-like [Vicia villosa]
MDRKQNLKRKITEEDVLRENSRRLYLIEDIVQHIDLLNSVSSSYDPDIGHAQDALCFLSDLANDEDTVNLLVICDVIPSLVKVLHMVSNGGEFDVDTYDINRDCVFILGLIVVKPEYQQLIVDAGALPCLVDLLMRPKAPDISQIHFSHLLGRVADVITDLAHDNNSIKTLVRLEGGIPPLVDLLESDDTEVHRAATEALRTLAFQNAENKDQVLEQMLYLMRFGEKVVQKRVALALAHLCSADDRKAIFIDNNGLELLLNLLGSTTKKEKREAAEALHTMATKGMSVSIVDLAPASPTPLVYMGEQYVNNPVLSDVTFIVEGKRFHAHRACLLSSDIFRAMFDGGYKEKESKEIEIPNIKWNVFELMMRFIYTGTVAVDLDIALDLLKAADQYLLDGLKRICESVIYEDISVENVSVMYVMSDTYNATSLKYSCILFILKHFDNVSAKPWYSRFIRCIKPDIQNFFSTLLTMPKHAS